MAEFLLGTNIFYKPALKGKSQAYFYGSVTNTLSFFVREKNISPTFFTVAKDAFTSHLYVGKDVYLWVV